MEMSSIRWKTGLSPWFLDSTHGCHCPGLRSYVSKSFKEKLLPLWSACHRQSRGGPFLR